TMASRIVVMKDGYIQQVGAPKEIYDLPDNLFVAGFIGTPPMNFIEGKVNEEGYFVCGDHKKGVSRFKIPTAKFNVLKEKKFIEKDIILGIRPEDIHDENVVIETYKDAKVKVKVDVAELLGAETLIYGDVNTQ